MEILKKVIYVILIFFIFSYCAPKQEKVEKIMEDGVEVVLNHLEPYKIKGRSSNLIIEEEFSIDTERKEIAETGLTDIGPFDVDSEENIYLGNIRSEKILFKFDRNGSFVDSFIKKGQGPGEMQWISCLAINSNGQIELTDPRSRKLVVFSPGGNLIQEIRMDSNVSIETSLANGKYLIYSNLGYGKNEYLHQHVLALYNSKFEKIKELDILNVPNASVGKRQKGTRYVFVWSVSKENIYVGNSERDYEIWTYDLEGKLLRKIRKEYRHLKIPQEVRKTYSKPYKRPWFKNIYFPKHMPPFQYLFTDDEGQLFVMTYEKDKNPKKYIYDIFNSDGFFVGRISLGNYEILDGELLLPTDVKAKNNRIYCLREKESGYKELLVYKMRWEYTD